MSVTQPKAITKPLLKRTNRNSQPMTEILLFHQPVWPRSQTSRWKRWLHILFFFSSVSSESVFFAYDTPIFTTRKLSICAYYLVFHFCQYIPRYTLAPLARSALTISPFAPLYMSGQGMVVIHFLRKIFAKVQKKSHICKHMQDFRSFFSHFYFFLCFSTW